MFDTQRLQSHVHQNWNDAIIPSLVDYIRIPNKSPAYDAEWAAHGYMDDAVRLMETWARQRLAALPGATLEVVRLTGRTPVIFIEIAHVLRSTYGLTREMIVKRLEAVLRLPAITGDLDLLSAALDIHRQRGVGLPDALLAAQALQSGPTQIVSFDRGFDRIPGVTRVTP